MCALILNRKKYKCLEKYQCISGALPSLPELVLHVAVVLVVVLEQAERPWLVCDCKQVIIVLLMAVAISCTAKLDGIILRASRGASVTGKRRTSGYQNEA